MIIKLINNISEISCDQWNQLLNSDYPFLRHEFFAALESSGSVSEKNGWRPRHCLVFDQQGVEAEDQAGDKKTLIAAMLLYEKNHSNGEYVFDHTWANAYRQHGLTYFPKWVTAIPFTPCEGNRLLIMDNIDPTDVYRAIIDFLKNKAEEENVSSWHCLFPTKEEVEILKNEDLIIREGVQFRWSNQGYTDFEDYLSTFNTKKRKNVHRERRWVSDQNIELIQVPGSEITEEQWQAFYQFYQMTYLKRGMPPYLELSFFSSTG